MSKWHLAHSPSTWRPSGVGVSAGLGLEVLDERLLDPEDAVPFQVLVAVHEDVCDERVLAGGGDHGVQVRGAHRGPADCLEHRADRPVVGGWGRAWGSDPRTRTRPPR